MELKTSYENTKNKKYMSGYNYQNVYNQVIETFHQCHSKKVFGDKITQILSQADSQSS